MPARRLVQAAAALIGYTLGYIAVAFVPLPRLLYDPVHRRFFGGTSVAPEIIGYYGQIVSGLGGALVGSLSATLAVWRAPPSPRVVALSSAWALSAVALAATYFLWVYWP